MRRCPLLPWWSEFVGDAAKVRNLSEDDRRQSQDENADSIITQSQKRIARAARSLWPIVKAWGPDYLAKRIEFFVAGKIKPEDEEFATMLMALRGWDACDIPAEFDDGDDIPF